ncbi:MAG: hypothetical protein ACR2GM_10110 [Nocardioidaceae bacterium]
MNTPTKLGAYAVGLLALFGAAAGVGNTVGPVDPVDAGHTSTAHTTGEPAQHGDHGASSDEMGEPPVPEMPGGLMVSEQGYTLSLTQELLPAGAATPVSFRILGPDGVPVTAYEETHDKDLHFIAVRRDMTGFQHVHPELGQDGQWSVPLSLTAGTWRVFADFASADHGEKLTLGADISVAGDYQPRDVPAPSTTAQVDGYTVTLDGQLAAGKESELTLSVSRDGKPVTDLQPYLAAYGHLVALRDGDLAYLHVHPVGEPRDGQTEPGPDIAFYATAPSAGDYRLFLDFQHNGVVRTVELTARAGATSTSGEEN